MTDFSQRRICGFSTGLVLFAIGLTSFIVSIIDRNTHSVPNCGVPGYPPLRDWLLGAGISYTIISITYGYMSLTDGKGKNATFVWIALIGPLWLFIWMIVGCVSLWRDGGDCQTINPLVWNTGMASVIISLIVVFLGGYVYHKTREEPEEEQEE